MSLLMDLRHIGRLIRSRDGLSWSRWRRYSRDNAAAATVNVPSQEVVTPLPPLTEPLPGQRAPGPPPRRQQTSTRVSTLDNGLRVASEGRAGQFCTVGVVIDSGSRYEVDYPGGISHFLEKLAFSSTQEFADKDKLLAELEKHGGICDSQSSRDTLVYATSADRRGLAAITKVLGEVVLRPQLMPAEVEAARQTVGFELQTLDMRPEQESLLMDMIHAAAFRDNTLGLPKLCPPASLQQLDRPTLLAYLRQHFTPARMVVAGVGVEHEALVESVQKYFVEAGTSWEEAPASKWGSRAPDASTSQYTGGIEQKECEIPLYPGSDLPELSHVVIALDGVSHQDDDFIAMCVLNMMMGGGGSFSAGGPGKGMYTRLYTNVLNRYHWMYNATAYNHSYGDGGLFCIHAAAPPPRLGDTVAVLLRELASMQGPCEDSELRRAKTQLQSMLLMNLEARPVVFEDIARQVLATGARKPPQHFIQAIEDITAKDIQRVSQRLLSSRPAVAARGRLSSLPTFQQIQDGLTQSPKSGRLSLFR